ncbi:MAG TPA: response regulator [Flavisolibacter sp.]|nr:response regulator [Flavisolibacter sp.]
MNEAHILIIDDEPQIRNLLQIALESNGYRVQHAASAKEGMVLSTNHPPDMVLLDLGLPDEPGQQLLKKLRTWYTKPIMIISVQNDELAIVNALDQGANDYLVKPFRTGELLARIRSALRMSAGPDDLSHLHFDGLEIDLVDRTVKKNGVMLKLTVTEYALLSLFAQNEGKVLTQQYILKQIWGPSFIEQSQYLRVYVAQLRKKIETDPNHPVHLITETGVGYRFLSGE